MNQAVGMFFPGAMKFYLKCEFEGFVVGILFFWWVFGQLAMGEIVPVISVSKIEKGYVKQLGCETPLNESEELSSNQLSLYNL